MVSPSQAFIIQTVLSCSVIKSLIIALVPSSLASAEVFKIVRSILSNSDNEITMSATAFSSTEIFFPTGTFAALV